MAVRFYDEAIATKIINWVKDPNLRVLKPDETSRLFELTLDQRKDKPLTLPLVALSRNRDIEITNLAKQAKSFDGYAIGDKRKERKIFTLNIIPIRISYQLDIYTRTIAEADEYIRNFVFNFINYPKIKITLPYYKFNIEQESNITLDPNIQDNSDIQEKLFADQFVRFTLKFSIEDAGLFSIAEKTAAEIDTELIIDPEHPEIGWNRFDVFDRTHKEIVESQPLIPEDFYTKLKE